MCVEIITMIAAIATLIVASWAGYLAYRTGQVLNENKHLLETSNKTLEYSKLFFEVLILQYQTDFPVDSYEDSHTDKMVTPEELLRHYRTHPEKYRIRVMASQQNQPAPEEEERVIDKKVQDDLHKDYPLIYSK